MEQTKVTHKDTIIQPKVLIPEQSKVLIPDLTLQINEHRVIQLSQKIMRGTKK